MEGRAGPRVTEQEALAKLRGSDAEDAAVAEAALWTMWSRSGIPEVDGFLRHGIEAMERAALDDAESTFSRIIIELPDFAEGWNKRATVRYLAQNYAGSIADCRETIARNPNHFGALSGQGLCHLALHQYREAAALFRRVLEIHPHLTAARQNLQTALGETVKGNGM